MSSVWSYESNDFVGYAFPTWFGGVFTVTVYVALVKDGR